MTSTIKNTMSVGRQCNPKNSKKTQFSQIRISRLIFLSSISALLTTSPWITLNLKQITNYLRRQARAAKWIQKILSKNCKIAWLEAGSWLRSMKRSKGSGKQSRSNILEIWNRFGLILRPKSRSKARREKLKSLRLRSNQDQPNALPSSARMSQLSGCLMINSISKCPYSWTQLEALLQRKTCYKHFDWLTTLI